jgi:hypothetical protein
MKKFKKQLVSTGILFISLFLAFSCKKVDTTGNGSASFQRPADTSNVPPPPNLQIDTSNKPRDSVIVTPPQNTAPVVFAGVDQFVHLPVNYITLNGRFKTQDQFGIVVWKKISGPSCKIENPTALSTKVSGFLHEGFYYFELTVFDKRNLFAKDTMVVEVEPDVIAGQNFVIYNSLNWTLPWYNTLEAPDIYSNIPPEVPIKVFVQRGSSNDWIPAPPVSNDPNNNNIYEYFIETRPDGAGMYTMGSLYILYYGSDINDNPKVKIEF